MEERHQTTNASRKQWKAECEQFIKMGSPFKVTATKAADREYVLRLAAKHEWGVATGSGTLYVYPAKGADE